MKKIMVCCGSSMITSTIAINKLKTAMANAGIDVKFIQCKFAEVQGKVKVERPDVIVPTGALKDSLTDSVPVVPRHLLRDRRWRERGHRRDHQDPARLIAERNRKARRYHCP